MIKIRLISAIVSCLSFLIIQGNSFGQDDLKQSSLTLDDIYIDESRCLTMADMRGERDRHISCFCRDAIVDARYVYSTYITTGKDHNLNGVFLTLENNITQTCGDSFDTSGMARSKEWKWYGPEVSRTYPSDEVIERIKPETRNGRAVGRWVPFTIQLIYRDEQGQVTRTENYSRSEFFLILPALPVFPEQN